MSGVERGGKKLAIELSSSSLERLSLSLSPSRHFRSSREKGKGELIATPYLGEAVPSVLVRLAVLHGRAGLGRRLALLRGEDEAAEGQGGDGG